MERDERCTWMHIRAKSYGVHMETSWRCVTNWARETNKLCRIYPSTGGGPICRYRPCIVCAYRSICIVTRDSRDAFRNCIPHTLLTRYECDRFIDRYGLLEKWNWYDQHYRVLVFRENNRFNNNFARLHGGNYQ